MDSTAPTSTTAALDLAVKHAADLEDYANALCSKQCKGASKLYGAYLKELHALNQRHWALVAALPAEERAVLSQRMEREEPHARLLSFDAIKVTNVRVDGEAIAVS